MKNSLPIIVQSCRKDADAHMLQQPAVEKYGLHLQSAFPMPAISESSSGSVRYHHQGIGELFSALSPTKAKTIQKHLVSPLKEKLPVQGYFAHTQLEDGLLVEFPEHSTHDLTHTIELAADQELAVAYILIIAKKHSKNSVIVSHRNNAPSHTIVHIICEEDAVLEVVTAEPQGSTPHFSLQYAQILDQAHFKSLQLVRNVDMLQSFTSTHVGQKSQVLQSHIAFGTRQSKHDMFSQVLHIGSDSQSQMLSKVILRDQAHTIYRGLVGMDGNAKNCISSEKEQTLLLSAQAKIDVVPMLEITNDDISCNHSASISNLDPEQLFYLQSRGFSYEQAESFIIQAFYSDVLKQFSNLSLCAHINEYISAHQFLIHNT